MYVLDVRGRLVLTQESGMCGNVSACRKSTRTICLVCKTMRTNGENDDTSDNGDCKGTSNNNDTNDRKKERL